MLGQEELLAADLLVVPALLDLHDGAEAADRGVIVVQGDDRSLLDLLQGEHGAGLGENGHEGFLLGRVRGLGGLGTRILGVGAGGDTSRVGGIVLRVGRVAALGPFGFQLGLRGRLASFLGQALDHVRVELAGADRGDGELFGGQGVDDVGVHDVLFLF